MNSGGPAAASPRALGGFEVLHDLQEPVIDVFLVLEALLHLAKVGQGVARRQLVL